MPLSLGALKLLRFMQSNPYAKVAALNVGSRTQTEVEYLLARYITVILERQLKSVEFLKLIRRGEAALAAGRLKTEPNDSMKPLPLFNP